MPSSFDEKQPQLKRPQLPGAPQRSDSVEAKSNAVQEARSRKQLAVETVVSGTDAISARVLERARQKVDARLEPKIEEISDRMAEKLEAKELSELQKLEDFFIQWSDSDLVLAPVRELMEAELIA